MLAAACGDDGDEAASSAPATATAPVDPLVAEAVAGYQDYVAGRVDEMVARTTVFTDAVRDGDLAAARAAYAPSRVPWESIEPIAGLIETTDGVVDARVDAFSGPDDPEFTGWHRLEYILWDRGTTDGATPFADQLDGDLAELQDGVATLEIPPADMALGASELIQEVSEGKITGEEDRYSKTDLWDFAANVEGAEAIIELLTPALREADPELLGSIEDGFAELDASIDELREGDGFVLFCQEDDPYPVPELCPSVTVTAQQIDALKGQLAGLSEDLALVPGALGLQ
jgi:iron uptake system component EfeO